MAVRLVAVCFAAADPRRLAGFWAEALRWEIAGGTGRAVELVPDDGTGLRVRFRPDPVPKAGKNRVHLDLTTTSAADQAGTVRRLVELGARPVDIGQGPDEPHVVLADPEGNELCVVEPGNAFLAGCGRLGSITGDGSPAAGYFWSAALGWPLVWDQDGETAIRAPGGAGPFVTWGPPVVPKRTRNRLHLDLAPLPSADQAAEVERLVALGAARLDAGPGDGDRIVLADPDGNELGVLPR